MKLRAVLAFAWILAFAASLLRAQSEDQIRHLAHDIFQQLIETNTTESSGNTTAAAEAMARLFRDAGFSESDVRVLIPDQDPGKGNLVVRMHGSGARRPILLIGHLDVVEARREDWSTDPFRFIETDGYFYGRGTQDMKDGDAIWVATLIRFMRERYHPDRDLILALTADEETGKLDGVDWLLRNHRDLIDAEFVLNADSGGVVTDKGKPVNVSVEASEKIYVDYQLEVKNPGGHSSLPTRDNAIYHLADGLARLERYQFPFELNEVTRAYFRQMAATQSAETAQDMLAILQSPPDQPAISRLDDVPKYHATMRTTCVATRLDAGHANNALPQTARAVVNCRILPGHTREEIRRKLVEIFADPQIAVRYIDPVGQILDAAPSEPPPPKVTLRPDVMVPLTKVSSEMWPGAPVIPTMATGASDGILTEAAGMPTYGISGVAIDFDDVRYHGRDERVRVQSFYDGLEFYYRFLKLLTSEQ
ncbi:MAG TPA: M20/M25/M40 family metallo-hydrolase [Candidatus Acidoferrales bacterium]|nr:M20/M25/M40 family metallo-hydrolase [Candidatus Acidoferrales bacterium]